MEVFTIVANEVIGLSATECTLIQFSYNPEQIHRQSPKMSPFIIVEQDTPSIAVRLRWGGMRFLEKTKICSHHHISDFAELHFLHSICRLSSVVCPPLLQGMMWSPSMSSKAYSVLMPFATHKGHL